MRVGFRIRAPSVPRASILWLAHAVKKFSGLQVVISKKLFPIEVHPHGRGSGANRLVNCMARLRLSRLSATEMGAARRVFFLRLHR